MLCLSSGLKWQCWEVKILYIVRGRVGWVEVGQLVEKLGKIVCASRESSSRETEKGRCNRPF
jgi:hypothetical protein